MIIRLRPNVLLYVTLILAGLKVAELIDWSWGWVLAPLWLPIAIVAGIGVIGLLFAATFLARLKKSFGWPTDPEREEIVINDVEGSVTPDPRTPRRIGNTYHHD